MIQHMFPELDLCRTDHAQPLITAGLDDDLSDQGEELDGLLIAHVS